MPGLVRSGRMTALLSSVLVGLALVCSPALAQSTKPADKKPATADAVTPPAPPPAPAAPAPTADVTAKVTGFRSAKFGMTEAEVQTAIAKDFPSVTGPAKELQNRAERTTVLAIKATDVLPDGGAAEISYIFGYKSKTLIQIIVNWSKQTDDALTPDALVANGEALRSYFVGEGFPASTVISNIALPDGVLLFRGTDSDGHQVLLVLKGTTTGTGTGPKTFTAQSTTLFYIQTTTNPDVFRVPAGKF